MSGTGFVPWCNDLNTEPVQRGVEAKISAVDNAEYLFHTLLLQHPCKQFTTTDLCHRCLLPVWSLAHRIVMFARLRLSIFTWSPRRWFKQDGRTPIRVMSVAMYSVNQLYARALLQYAADAKLCIPEALQQGVEQSSRLPLELLDQLWEACCESSADPLAGLRIGLNLQPGHLDSAGLLLMTCATIGEALEQLVDVAPIVGSGGEFTLSREGNEASICYQPNLATRQAERVEAVLAGTLSLARWASGGSFMPSELRFVHKPLGARASYSELLDTNVAFQASENALTFPVDQLELPLIQANAALCDYLHTLTERTLAELGCQSLSAKTQKIIQRYPRWGKDRIAAEMEIGRAHV